MVTKTTEDRWLRGKKEIANYLGYSSGKDLIRRWEKNSSMPIKLVDGKVFMAKASDLDAWVNGRPRKCPTCGTIVKGCK